MDSIVLNRKRSHTHRQPNSSIDDVRQWQSNCCSRKYCHHPARSEQLSLRANKKISFLYQNKTVMSSATTCKLPNDMSQVAMNQQPLRSKLSLDNSNNYINNRENLIKNITSRTVRRRCQNYLVVLKLVALCCYFLLENYGSLKPNHNAVEALLSPNYNAPFFSSPNQCPLEPACQCKVSSGKQSAMCEKSNLFTIPSQLHPDTQVLDMSGSSLQQLSAHVFKDRHLTNLQKLFLADCSISFIAEAAFDQLTNLYELDLSKNSLAQVPQRSFDPIKQSLWRLSLAGNPIETIESDTFSHLTYLKTLDLNNCHLMNLKPNAFRGLSQLKELKLADNRLVSLTMSVIGDLRAPKDSLLTTELMGNPWHCDCELKQSIDWMSRHNIAQSIEATCATPLRLKDIRWAVIKPEEFICPPVVINKQNDLVVGAGSNVSLSCSARGSAPLTFVWFQDEKNLTTSKPANTSDPPASTKLLEEKRYEISEELGPPNVTTSILYLFNLKLTDTSLFLCWVENSAGYTVTNFSLVVNDSPPAQFVNGMNGATNSFTDFILRSVGLGQGETQLGVITTIFVIVLLMAAILLLILRHSSRSSSSSDNLKRGSKTIAHPHISSPKLGTISSSNKFSKNGCDNRHSITGSDDEADEQNYADRYSESDDSDSSCRKNSKVMVTEDLGSFIEHMRSGIINMDYHSMSPVIQFNNNTSKSTYSNNDNLKQQPYSNTTSNVSSIPNYVGMNGGGSASMATTTSDLSPNSITGISSDNLQLQNRPPPTTNCDFQHPLNMTSSITNTNYTNNYQSGHDEHSSNMINNMMPPPYYYPEHLDPNAIVDQQQAHQNQRFYMVNEMDPSLTQQQQYPQQYHYPL